MREFEVTVAAGVPDVDEPPKVYEARGIADAARQWAADYDATHRVTIAGEGMVMVLEVVDTKQAAGGVSAPVRLEVSGDLDPRYRLREL